jgi:hypothetical protein
MCMRCSWIPGDVHAPWVDLWSCVRAVVEFAVVRGRCGVVVSGVVHAVVEFVVVRGRCGVVASGVVYAVVEFTVVRACRG